jgi:6-pyruvoyltetrahydropterin/6-carboxytetrahydropterin synthase
MIALTKIAQFSAAHYYHLPELSPEENLKTFYACSNLHGHGHNYTLHVTVAGRIDPATGMVMNLNDIKAMIQQAVIGPLDHKNLNTQVKPFDQTVPTLENICLWIWHALNSELETNGFTGAGVQLSRIKLIENDTLFAEYYGGKELPMTTQSPAKTVYLTRCYDFSASHRLFNPAFADEDNWRIFGKCNNPNGHGHNYDLEIILAGEPDEKTGMLVDIVALDAIVQREILDEVDHKHLNEDVPMFSGINPTAENIAVVFWQRLADKIPAPGKLHRIRLYESKRNYVEYSGV